MGKGGGTVAAAVTAVAIYGATFLAPPSAPLVRTLLLPVITLVLTALGIWSGNGVEAVWGKDSSKVVLDEVAGMLVTMVFHPLRWGTILVGLILFRFFDIAKPLGIRKTEELPGGWGVMVDDVLAGIYASIVLLIVEQFNWI
jgi:phosphatidylglycerophosphatase A